MSQQFSLFLFIYGFLGPKKSMDDLFNQYREVGYCGLVMHAKVESCLPSFDEHVQDTVAC